MLKGEIKMQKQKSNSTNKLLEQVTRSGIVQQLANFTFGIAMQNGSILNEQTKNITKSQYASDFINGNEYLCVIANDYDKNGTIDDIEIHHVISEKDICEIISNKKISFSREHWFTIFTGGKPEKEEDYITKHERFFVNLDGTLMAYFNSNKDDIQTMGFADRLSKQHQSIGAIGYLSNRETGFHVLKGDVSYEAIKCNLDKMINHLMKLHTKKVLDSNLDMLGSPNGNVKFVEAKVLRENGISGKEYGYKVYEITYNTDTGTISSKTRERGDSPEQRFSTVLVAFDRQGLYWFRPFNNPNNLVTRFSSTNNETTEGEFGTKSGDLILAESIKKYNEKTTQGRSYAFPIR